MISTHTASTLHRFTLNTRPASRHDGRLRSITVTDQAIHVRLAPTEVTTGTVAATGAP